MSNQVIQIEELKNKFMEALAQVKADKDQQKEIKKQEKEENKKKAQEAIEKMKQEKIAQKQAKEKERKEAEEKLKKEKQAQKEAKAKERKQCDMSDYYKVKAVIEKSWFKLLDPTCYVKINIDGSLTMRDATKTNEYMKHIKFTITDHKGSRRVPFYPMWSTDESIRIYNNLVYAPPPAKYDARTEYNTYVSPEHKGKVKDIDDIHELLRSLVNYEEHCYKYLVYYIADIIQNAGRVMKSHGTCLLFRGHQGAGKGNLEKLLSKLLGSINVCLTSDLNKLIAGEANRFASSAVDRLVICIDEANTKGGYSRADELKSAITQEEIEYEKKGVQGTFKVKFYGRYIIFTNHENSMKVEHTDRRYVVFQTSEKYAGSNGLEFGEKINILLSNPDYISSVYTFFKNVVIPESFKFKRDRPMTDAYIQMREHNIPITIKYLAEIIQESSKPTIEEQAQFLFNDYLRYIQDNNYRVQHTSCMFYNSLKELEKAGVQKIKKSCMYYAIDSEKFKKYCQDKKYNMFDNDTSTDKINIKTAPSLLLPLKISSESNQTMFFDCKKWRDEIYQQEESIKKKIEQLKQSIEQKKSKLKPKTTPRSSELSIIFDDW